MRISAIFGAKNFGIFEIYGVSAILFGRRLWTAPYRSIHLK